MRGRDVAQAVVIDSRGRAVGIDSLSRARFAGLHAAYIEIVSEERALAVVHIFARRAVGILGRAAA